jgi:general stress protein 26
MDLERIKRESARLSPWAHVATVGADGDPDVAPVHPAWEGGTLWFLTGANSVKVRNLAHHPIVAMHWQVDESGDGVEVWGAAEVYADVATKQRLWNGVFDYDLNQFAPGGPENSPDFVFVAVRPQRALYLEMYGMKARETWST